jgi:hypothetical protein
MKPPSRRLERVPAMVDALRQKADIVHDFTSNEAVGKFVEGTGSLVIDRSRRVAYLCESERSNASLAKVGGWGGGVDCWRRSATLSACGWCRSARMTSRG